MRPIVLTLVLFICFSSPLQATEIDCPTYRGGVYGGASWLFLQPSGSDADLEYGSLITLTDDPANLNAHLLEVNPDYQHAFRLNLGYELPCTNTDIRLNYLYFNGNNKDSTDITSINQLIQCFLGGAFGTSKGVSRHQLNQVDLTYGKRFSIDKCLDIHPYIGFSYGDIHRKFDVTYTELVLSQSPGFLDGTEKSDFWGAGPIIGTDFSYPLFCNFSVGGHIGGGAWIGRTRTSLNSNGEREEIEESFSQKYSYTRVVPFINSGLELAYTHSFYNNCFGLKIAVGYETDYYFKGIDKVTPFNGFFNNPNTFPINTSSNLGLGGPYVLISLLQLPFDSQTNCCWNRNECCGSGFYGRATAAWLEPSPSNKDLNFCTLIEADGSEKEKHATPKHSWSGSYDLGYRFGCNLDIRGSYFHYDANASTTVTARTGEEISSLNASGPAEARFSEANSKINYKLDQFDLLLGKHIQLTCSRDLFGFFGLRYAHIKRRQHNVFTGGVPSEVTEEKSPLIKSEFEGVGPMFGLEPDLNLCGNLHFVGRLGVALLIGDTNSKLDQTNNGDIGFSSNTLRMRNTPSIVPVVDAKAGLSYSCSLQNCISFKVEAGYQFTEYYRGIDMTFPDFLTGLGQRHSNLKLSGPYVGLEITNF